MEGPASLKLVKTPGQSSPCPQTCGQLLPDLAPRQGWGPEVDSSSESVSRAPEWHGCAGSVSSLGRWHLLAQRPFPFRQKTTAPDGPSCPNARPAHSGAGA